MQPFSKHPGLVAPLDRVNVDTDQMVPKQFLKLLTREGYGQFLFYDWRYLDAEKPNPDFVLNQPRYQGASILLARANFGCGSSREHAPWALLDYGFKAIIAPSFADIFYNNCFKNGILPIKLSDSDVELLFRAADDKEIEINLAVQEVLVAHKILHFQVDGYRKKKLLEGLDDIGITLKMESQIAEYEKKKSTFLTT